MDAMLFLIQRIESHCCFDDYAQRITIVKTYLRSFTDVVGIALDAQKEPASLRLVWDLRFLIAICGSWGSDLTSSCAALEKSLVRVVKVKESNPKGSVHSESVALLLVIGSGNKRRYTSRRPEVHNPSSTPSLTSTRPLRKLAIPIIRAYTYEGPCQSEG